MDTRSRSLDDIAFALALGAITLTGLAFAARHNGGAAVMCLISLAGLIGGRVVGVSGIHLLPVAIGLVGILYLAWVDPPGDSRTTSAVAHVFGGVLVGGALAATLRRRLDWPAWALAAVLGLVAITTTWEFCEYIGDRIFDTALLASKRDSALDIFFGCLGGSIALLVAYGFDLRRRRDLR